MADVVHLHVGAPKTGTTYVQGRLYANRSALAGHGVHYPVGPNADMFPPALDLIDRHWGGLRDAVRGEWAALASRIRRSSGTVVVSQEFLAAARPEQVTRAMQDLGDAEVHVVYSARDIARQVPAAWQELVKHRDGRSYRSFLKSIRRAERRGSSVWFWQVQGLPDVLNRWGQGLPTERIHVVTVPQADVPSDEVWRRCCTAFGIDPAWAPQDAARSNASLGIDEVALLRALNRRLKRAGLDSAPYRRLVRQVVVHDQLARRDAMRRVVLPPRLTEWAGEIADEWIAWIEASGVEVIGSVEDLRPTPTPHEAWSDPDRPEPRRLADAALDALVAVVLEAASAPAPEPASVPLLGRATRRLRG